MMVITIVMAIYGIGNNDWKLTGSAHHVLGLIILFTIFFQTVGGVFTRSRMNRLNWRNALMLKVKIVHRVKIYLKFIIYYYSHMDSF